MSNLQTGIASILCIAFLAALPGVYFYTEGGMPADPAPSKAANQEPSSPSNSKSVNLANYEPVPKPPKSKLPETDFELQPLTKQQKRQVARQLMIDINKAPKSQLKEISGVGPATADAIIKYRQEHGGFDSLKDLDKISGIGPATIENFRGEVKISGQIPKNTTVASTGGEDNDGSEGKEKSSSGGPTVNVNSASASELEKLDGIGPVTAGKIIEFRKSKGPISSVEEMDKIDGIGPATVEDLRGNVTF